jgi:tetratricopeptide (TPR) repeat protein
VAYHRAVDLDNELPAESNLLPTQKESDIEPPDDRSYEAIQNFAYFLMGINQVHNQKFGPILELLSLIALHPVWKWIALAALHLELKEYEAALDALDHASGADPKDYISWLNKGNILNNLGKFDEALAAFDHVLVLSPEESEAWSGRGISLYNKGKFTEALLTLDHAASIHSEDQTIWAYKGFVLHDLKRYKEAHQNSRSSASRQKQMQRVLKSRHSGPFAGRSGRPACVDVCSPMSIPTAERAPAPQALRSFGVRACTAAGIGW